MSGGGARSQARSARYRLFQVAAFAAIVAAFIAVSRLLPNVDLQQALDDVSTKLGAFTYPLVGLAAFVETGAFVGLVLPGETVVILGGAVAGQGETSIVLTIGIVWAGAFAGDSVSFLLGHRLGRGFIIRHGPRFRVTHERFARVEAYFQRHGGKTILVGRFIGLVRALAPFIAGSSAMRYRNFAPYSVLGTGLWAAVFALVGYFASRSLDAAARVAGRGTLVFGIAVAVIVAVVVSIRFLRDPRNRAMLVAGMERRPVLRGMLAVGRRLQPHARFVAARLTPGELGLEFTSLLAILAVSLYVVVAYTVVVSGDPGPAAGDQGAMDAARDLNAGWLTDVAKAVSELGAAAVIVPLSGLVALLLAIRRRWADAAVLVIATVIVYVAVAALKGATDRPRPAGALTGAQGSAFPSGHAAHAILYPWLALILTVRLRPHMAGRSALVALGVVLAAAIGLARVYLRVHYLSDVSAGWALGVAAFSACAAVAMTVMYLRHNGGRDGPSGNRD